MNTESWELVKACAEAAPDANDGELQTQVHMLYCILLHHHLSNVALSPSLIRTDCIHAVFMYWFHSLSKLQSRVFTKSRRVVSTARLMCFDSVRGN